MSFQGIEPRRKAHPDLIWDLGPQHDRELAERLLRQLENRLCIHSGATSRLHAGYRLDFPAGSSQMIVQADTQAVLDTFHHVSPLAVRRTGLCLLPGQRHDQRGLLLARLSKDGQTLHARPLKSALALIVSTCRQRGEAFLPVLVKGDLGECDRRMPLLHLHRLQPNDLPHLSPFERHDLQRTITRKLLDLYRDADSLGC